MRLHGSRVRNARRLIRVVCVLSAAVLTAAALLAPAGCNREPRSATGYYCPMHPTYTSDRPGDCPICNMRLEPRPAAPDTAATRGQDTHSEHAPGTPDAAAPNLPGHAPLTLDTRARALAGVQVAAARQARLERRVRTVGTVMPDEGRVRHIHVKVGGFVEKLYIRNTGQVVRRGEPAFELYSPELIASQEEYLRVLQAARELPGTALPDARRGAESLLRAAQRRLESFDVPPEFITALERSGEAQRTVTIPAHAGGIVINKSVVEGERVEPNMMLYTVADLSRVWVEAQFYENEVPLLRAGQLATVALPHDPGRVLSGTIAYIYPYVQTASRTQAVRFEFANADLTLKPGMFVDVQLDVAAAEGVVVPESAILDTGERQIVFVVHSGNHFEPRAVRTGLRSEGHVQVLDGVAPGDTVVVRANFLLDSESRLRGALGASAGTGGGTPDAHRSHTGSTP